MNSLHSLQKLALLTIFISLDIFSAAAPKNLFKIDSGVCRIQGIKDNQEDQYIVDDQRGIFGVFDGHDGDAMANYASGNFIPLFEKAAGNDEEKFNGAYTAMEEYAKRSYYNYTMTTSGTTAVVAALRGNQLTVANTGDSRAMLFRKKGIEGSYEPVLRTRDHKPAGTELERIKKFGACTIHKIVDYVALAGTSQRVCVVTRVLGDIDTKEKRLGRNGYQILIPTPEIYSETIQSGDILTIASDGYWDFYDHVIKYNPRAEQFLHAQITKANVSAEAKAKTMVSEVDKYERGQGSAGATDNVTAVVVQFLPVEEEKQSD